MKFSVTVTLKKNVLDPQGKVVQNTLKNLGMLDLKSIRQGKFFEIEIEEKNEEVAKKKVNVKYGEQTINSKILKLNFKDNLIEILDNVQYINNHTKIKADKVEIDLLYKSLKISMINKADKVSIISNY